MSTRIRRARAIAGITQGELARRLGIHRSAVTQWERLSGTSPSVQHLTQIACETAVCFEWLATGRGPTQPEPSTFAEAVVMKDFARDEMESQVLEALRRVTRKRRDMIVTVVEVLST